MGRRAVTLPSEIVEKLGRISDQQLADEAGLTKAQIMYARKRFGIAPSRDYRKRAVRHRKGSMRLLRDELREAQPPESRGPQGVIALPIRKEQMLKALRALQPEDVDSTGVTIRLTLTLEQHARMCIWAFAG